MDEMIKSIRAALYDRAVSPLSGGVFVAWILWNFKILLVVIFGETLAERFEQIGNLTIAREVAISEFSMSIPYLLSDGFLFPLITAVLYIYYYPIAAAPIYKHTLAKQRELREIKQEVERARILTKEESAKILIELAEIESKFEVEFGRIKEQNQALIDEKNSLTEDNLKLRTDRDNEFNEVRDQLDAKYMGQIQDRERELVSQNKLVEKEKAIRQEIESAGVKTRKLLENKVLDLTNEKARAEKELIFLQEKQKAHMQERDFLKNNVADLSARSDFLNLNVTSENDKESEIDNLLSERQYSILNDNISPFEFQNMNVSMVEIERALLTAFKLLDTQSLPLDVMNFLFRDATKLQRKEYETELENSAYFGFDYEDGWLLLTDKGLTRIVKDPSIDPTNSLEHIWTPR